MSKLQSFESFNEEKKDKCIQEVIKKPVALKSLKSIKESNEEGNYMFFSNLETIKRLVDKLLEMDKTEIDAMLNEHDWASDHITSSKDDIEEVFNFIASHNTEEDEDWDNMSHDEIRNEFQ